MGKRLLTIVMTCLQLTDKTTKQTVFNLKDETEMDA
jgi:hypothetical protein